MTNPRKSEIIVVLDRSGSMQSCKSDTIGGFNAFVQKHQEAAKDEVLITLAQFDDQYDLIYTGCDIRSTPLLNNDTYVPRGMTALYDAVGRTIDAVGQRLKNTPENDRPSKLIFVILTDGHENHSREYSLSRINEMIKHQSEKYSWQFVFLGADQDAFQGQSLGVHAQNVFTYRSADTKGTYNHMIDATCAAVNCLSPQDFQEGTLNFGGTMAACSQGITDQNELSKILKTINPSSFQQNTGTNPVDASISSTIATSNSIIKDAFGISEADQTRLAALLAATGEI